MDNLMWKAIYQDGKVISQFENGNYNNFTELNKNGMLAFSVINTNNNCNYTINLKTGQFVFNGVPISPALNKDDFDIDCITNAGYDYSENLFWYNELSSSVGVFGTSQNCTKCEETYMGYLVRVNVPYKLNDIDGFVIAARPMLKIKNKTNKVLFSMSFVFKYKDGDNYKTIVF